MPCGQRRRERTFDDYFAVAAIWCLSVLLSMIRTHARRRRKAIGCSDPANIAHERVEESGFPGQESWPDL